MFHKFEIKDDELLPYTEKNDFINGTLFHAWIYFEQYYKSEKHIYFSKMDILEEICISCWKKNNLRTSQKPQNALGNVMMMIVSGTAKVTHTFKWIHISVFDSMNKSGDKVYYIKN